MTCRDAEQMSNEELQGFRELRERIGAEITYRPYGCGQCGDWFESESILEKHDCPYPVSDESSFSAMIKENLSPTKEKLCDMLFTERLSRLPGVTATTREEGGRHRRNNTAPTTKAQDWWMPVLFIALYCLVLVALSEYFKLPEMLACLVDKWLLSSRA